MMTTTVAFFKKRTRSFDNRFAFLIMRKLKFGSHLDGVFWAGFSTLRAERAIIQIENRAFLPINLMHGAGTRGTITGA